ncbi:hypothetical protein [Arenibacter amylolyticus]|uniref:hypothetical protein n=1 Tax=Arenibacter amylolyticus TaxID=1406873 RepID=UPI000A3883DE|nr:hypothetical protein [Arenibacter amylolyticus]
MENNFKPIAAYELPAHIIRVLFEEFNTYTLLHAFVNDAGMYKLYLIFEADTIHTVYIDNDSSIVKVIEDSWDN